MTEKTPNPYSATAGSSPSKESPASDLQDDTELSNIAGGENLEFEPLVLIVDPGDASAELIAELYLKLDAIYRAQGGSGLHFKREEFRTFQNAEA